MLHIIETGVENLAELVLQGKGLLHYTAALLSKILLLDDLY